MRDNGDGGCCHAERATVFNLETISVTTPSVPVVTLLPMFVGVIVLMALTVVTVVAIGRMQRKADNS